MRVWRYYCMVWKIGYWAYIPASDILSVMDIVCDWVYTISYTCELGISCVCVCDYFQCGCNGFGLVMCWADVSISGVFDKLQQIDYNLMNRTSSDVLGVYLGLCHGLCVMKHFYSFDVNMSISIQDLIVNSDRCEFGHVLDRCEYFRCFWQII